MTPEEKKYWHYKWDRFQRRYEAIYTRKFKAALHDQIIQYAYKGFITSTPIYEVLVDLYKTVGSLWAHATQVQVKRQQVKARMSMGFNERIVELMRQYYGLDLLNDAEEITQYTREIIVRVLSDAAMSGASIADIVRELSGSTELSTMRARRIARTETVNAANGASLANAKDSGVPMRKIWLSVSDRRTRHSHMELDEVTIDLDAAFNAGGNLILHPGDRVQTNGLPTDASETVNCRCSLGYQVVK